MVPWLFPDAGVNDSVKMNDSAWPMSRLMIEALEERRLLSAAAAAEAEAGGDGRVAAQVVEVDGTEFELASNPQITGQEVFLGQFDIRRSTNADDLDEPERRVQLNFTGADEDGRLVGAMAIEDVGVFSVTGIEQPGRRLTVVFNDEAEGFVTGRLREGEFAGRTTISVGGETLRGRMELAGSSTSQFGTFADEFGFNDDGLILDTNFTDNEGFFLDPTLFDENGNSLFVVGDFNNGGFGGTGGVGGFNTGFDTGFDSGFNTGFDTGFTTGVDSVLTGGTPIDSSFGVFGTTGTGINDPLLFDPFLFPSSSLGLNTTGTTGSIGLIPTAGDFGFATTGDLGLNSTGDLGVSPTGVTGTVGSSGLLGVPGVNTFPSGTSLFF